MPAKKSKVDVWIKRENSHKKKALENASRHFDKDDSLSVNLLEAIYAQESSFGTMRGKRNAAGAAGDFQLEKKTAVRMGLTVTKENDQRFDVDDSAAAAAKYLKIQDDSYSKGAVLTGDLKTIAVSDSEERIKFVIASYNAGEGRIAAAQLKAKLAGKDPQKWDDVMEFLEAAGATAKKADEIRSYVWAVFTFAKEFSEKSKADKEAKNREPGKVNGSFKGGHWITKGGRHILI